MRIALIAGPERDFEETAVTSPDWMKAFDAPESPREISPRFSDCALAVMGFMAANYPARIESKCKRRQQRSSPVYQEHDIGAAGW